eukprot:scaffold421_cov382-Prasinococcus_capsulatus_cf.AAC.14
MSVATSLPFLPALPRARPSSLSRSRCSHTIGRAASRPRLARVAGRGAPRTGARTGEAHPARRRCGHAPVLRISGSGIVVVVVVVVASVEPYSSCAARRRRRPTAVALPAPSRGCAPSSTREPAAQRHLRGAASRRSNSARCRRALGRSASSSRMASEGARAYVLCSANHHNDDSRNRAYMCAR